MKAIDLLEGVNDPGIFKAVFILGSPGAGKSYIEKKLALSRYGLKLLDPDIPTEYLMRKHDLDFKMPPEEHEQFTKQRYHAADLNTNKMNRHVQDRLGIIVTGTGKDANKIVTMNEQLKSIGYQTLLVYVTSDLMTAMKRNLERERSIPSDLLLSIFKRAQNTQATLMQAFGDSYIEVDNSANADLDLAPVEKQIRAFVSAPLTNTARDWLGKKAMGISESRELDIPRHLMPQINQSHLEGHYQLSRGKADINKLISSQKQRVPGKIQKTKAKIVSGEISDRPIIVDRRGYIVNGHHRYAAYQELGVSQVPVLVVKDATIFELIDKFQHTASSEFAEGVNETTAGGIAGVVAPVSRVVRRNPSIYKKKKK